MVSKIREWRELTPDKFRARGTHMSQEQVRECLAVLAKDKAEWLRQQREREETT
jgi:hypothetical protein